MKGIVQNISEITDSKEMYEAKPHPFLSIFIYILLIMVIACLVWMYYGEIDIVSKGRGVIRPNENMSVIRNKTAGVIEKNEITDGKKVKKGELLFSIDDGDLEIKKTQLKEKLEKEKLELKNLKQLKKSIEVEKNLFDAKKEQSYYEKYTKYVQDREALKTQVDIDSKNDKIELDQTNLSKTRHSEEISKYTKKLGELDQYKRSVEVGNSQFEDDKCEESLMFISYLYNWQDLDLKIKDKRQSYELNKALEEENLLSTKELEASRAELEVLQNEQLKLKLDELKKIEDEIEDYTKLKEVAEKEQEKLVVDHGLLSDKALKRKLSIKQYKTNELVSLESQIQKLAIEVQSESREIEGMELMIKDCKVIAPIDGTINMIEDINVGDLMSQGSEVARIIPDDAQLYKVEILVPNSKIAGLKEGETVEYQFDALPYKEYGKLKGHITNISTDASTPSEENMGMSGYYVIGQLENKQVYSYKGDKVSLKVGMTCDAYIIVEQKKILYYILEKINLKE